jgi:hypothetical protein
MDSACLGVVGMAEEGVGDERRETTVRCARYCRLMPNSELYMHVCVYMREGNESTKGSQSNYILGFPVVTSALVTTLMKTTPRHYGVFALARTPCALTESPMLFFSISLKSSTRHNVLACRIGTSNGWCPTRDLTPTAEETGDPGFASCPPLCRR